MSAERFDELARALAQGTSRRAALRGLASWAAKGVAVALGVSAATGLGTQTASAIVNWCQCLYDCNGPIVVRCYNNRCKPEIHALNTTCSNLGSQCLHPSKKACEAA